MTINIVDSCYLNQFWNGEVDIHQHVREGKEITQTLTLANYDQSALELDYRMDESDLLIPLESGDYLVYYPTKSFSETPLDPASQTVVGMILYYDDAVDLTDYHIDYYCQRAFTEGPAFILFVVMGALLGIALITSFVAQRAYRQAEMELELRKSGLSCTSEIYAIIYLVDLNANTIVPVGVDEKPISSVRNPFLPTTSSRTCS